MTTNRRRRFLTLAFAAFVTLAPDAARAQNPPAELGQGWLPEFALTSRNLLALAEATPAEKFSWRPGKGVRSIAEVYMHVVLANYVLLGRAGVTPPVEMSKLPKEAAVTSKADVIKWLRDSLDAVSKAYPTADRQKKVQLFGKDTTADGVFLRLLIHNNEHLGQSIAYARMNGIVPPWSQLP